MISSPERLTLVAGKRGLVRRANTTVEVMPVKREAAAMAGVEWATDATVETAWSWTSKHATFPKVSWSTGKAVLAACPSRLTQCTVAQRSCHPAPTQMATAGQQTERIAANARSSSLSSITSTKV